MLHGQILEAVLHTASSQVEAGQILQREGEVQAIKGLVLEKGIDLLVEKSLEGHASMARLVEAEAVVMAAGRDRKVDILDLDDEIVEAVAVVVDSFWSACFACCRQSRSVTVVVGRLGRYCDSLALGDLALEDSRIEEHSDP